MKNDPDFSKWARIGVGCPALRRLGDVIYELDIGGEQLGAVSRHREGALAEARRRAVACDRGQSSRAVERDSRCLRHQSNGGGKGDPGLRRAQQELPTQVADGGPPSARVEAGGDSSIDPEPAPAFVTESARGLDVSRANVVNAWEARDASDARAIGHPSSVRIHRQSGFLRLKRACLTRRLLPLFFFVSFFLLVFATLLLLLEIGCLVQGTLLQGRNVSGSITASRSRHQDDAAAVAFDLLSARCVTSDNLNDYNVLLGDAGFGSRPESNAAGIFAYQMTTEARTLPVSGLSKGR